ncbi:hypothetical protein HZS_373 [Henneguya salminicola]|nr:hypothetical protein HZS_373 [Henneguya salminicola]
MPVAIIVPLRNRDSQMVTFLNHMHPILHRQNIYYQIFGIVQSEKGEFNRGKLFNVGFMEALLLENFDCFILHDVDFLLLNDHLKYLCDDSPSHFGTAASQFNYAITAIGYHAHRQIKERALYYSNPINHYRIINPILYKKNEYS